MARAFPKLDYSDQPSMYRDEAKEPRKCPVCGKTFMASPRQIYCGRACVKRNNQLRSRKTFNLRKAKKEEIKEMLRYEKC